MAQVVFILGAGASRNCGGPLMSDFLDMANDLYRRGNVDESREQFETLFKARSYLQRTHSKSALDIRNIESVFAAFEMARTIGGFGEYDSDRIEEVIRAIKTVIVKTIEHTVRCEFDRLQNLHAPHPYTYFAHLVWYVASEAKPSRSVSVITFNYDMALDVAFHTRGTPVFYGLEETKPERSVPLLKLHGSLNWRKCSQCRKITAWNLRDFRSKYGWPPVDDMNPILDVGSKIGDLKCACGSPVEGEPVIVPPTWNKTEYHQSLRPVWHNASRELGEAEYIFVIGYSLPKSDEFFRYLYALGTVGPTVLRSIRVFDKDATGAVRQRFKDFLGPGAEKVLREDEPMEFPQALKEMGEPFGWKPPG